MNLTEMYCICTLEFDGFTEKFFGRYLVLLTESVGVATYLNLNKPSRASSVHVSSRRVT